MGESMVTYTPLIELFAFIIAVIIGIGIAAFEAENGPDDPPVLATLYAIIVFVVFQIILIRFKQYKILGFELAIIIGLTTIKLIIKYHEEIGDFFSKAKSERLKKKRTQDRKQAVEDIEKLLDDL